MKPKNTLTLDNEFILYCELNKITDINKKAEETFNRGFSLLKYGETPSGKSTIKEKVVEVIKEVVVEKIIEKEIIKEVPVEIIKEVFVEVIKEIPIEVKGDTEIITKEVIREVPIEKIVEVINNEELEKLLEENKQLKDKLNQITSSLDKLNKGSMMKNSDLNSLYDE